MESSYMHAWMYTHTNTHTNMHKHAHTHLLGALHPVLLVVCLLYCQQFLHLLLFNPLTNSVRKGNCSRLCDSLIQRLSKCTGVFYKNIIFRSSLSLRKHLFFLPTAFYLLLGIHLPTTITTTLENWVLSSKYTPFSRAGLDVWNGAIGLKVSLSITALAWQVKHPGFYTQYQAIVIDIVLIASNVI